MGKIKEAVCIKAKKYKENGNSETKNFAMARSYGSMGDWPEMRLGRETEVTAEPTFIKNQLYHSCYHKHVTYIFFHLVLTKQVDKADRILITPL